MGFTFESLRRVMKHRLQDFSRLSVFSSEAQCQIQEPCGFLWIALLEGKTERKLTAQYSLHSLDQRETNGDGTASVRLAAVHPATVTEVHLSQSFRYDSIFRGSDNLCTPIPRNDQYMYLELLFNKAKKCFIQIPDTLKDICVEYPQA